ncbi:MAG: ABC transporter permease, partial [Chloroflexi bacterium]|nr:ABC transporter permease [Chloroflexota bacterium]
MSLIETLRTALSAILSNKLRAALTMLGIVIGVAAVITLSGLGEGVTASITEQIEGVGSNIIMVSPRQPRDATRPAELTNADAAA